MRTNIKTSLKYNHMTKIASISKAVIKNIDLISDNMQNNGVPNIEVVITYKNQEGRMVKKSTMLAEYDLRAYFDSFMVKNHKIDNLELSGLEISLKGVDDHIIQRVKTEYVETYNRVSKQQTEQFKKKKLQEIANSKNCH